MAENSRNEQTILGRHDDRLQQAEFSQKDSNSSSNTRRRGGGGGNWGGRGLGWWIPGLRRGYLVMMETYGDLMRRREDRQRPLAATGTGTSKPARRRRRKAAKRREEEEKKKKKEEDENEDDEKKGEKEDDTDSNAAAINTSTVSRPGTDEGGSTTPSQTQPRQFISTPRFAAPSTTQPQSQSTTTPIVPGNRRPFVSSTKITKTTADEIDILDSSPLPEDEDGPDNIHNGQPSRPLRRTGLQKHDSIVENSPSPSPSINSSNGIFEGNHHGYEETPPAPKRRRITVSPASIEHVSSSSRALSEVENHYNEDHEIPHIPDSEPGEIPKSEAASPFEPYENKDIRHNLDEQPANSDDGADPMHESVASDVEMSFEARFEYAQQQRDRHPKFRAAPRFVTTEPSEQRQFFLPDAFSPQRRGARYTAGGLAAEVRDWLFQVKSDGNEPRYDHLSEQPILATPAAEYIADEVSAGPGMQMLTARPAWSTEADAPSRNDGENTKKTEHLVKLILAGDGRISGLGGKNIVKQNTVVVVHPPTWEINLQDQGIWTMVCDWRIADGITL
ncbi:hypothetical protein PspLS_09078 [Pyricularia sp. CBS 133598]|nr:hypothetical protein PspLS_09078 [Pyricularia sp. CBS 133598]